MRNAIVRTRADFEHENYEEFPYRSRYGDTANTRRRIIYSPLSLLSFLPSAE
jgi:hypothetical protein